MGDEAFRLQSYQVVKTGGGGADDGVDLVLKKDRETFLVQCKQWRAYKVGVTVVRELCWVMAARGATGGFVVTSGRPTREATEFADGRNLWLRGGAALIGMIRQAQAARGAAIEPASAASHAAAESATISVAPASPNCASSMVRRTAKRGANAGGSFWGCQTYPTCRGIRPII